MSDARDSLGVGPGAVLRARAILFDLDGVLVDSHLVVERVWKRWSERHGLTIPDLVRRAHGRRSVETIRELAPILDTDAEVRWLHEAELNDTEGLVALPGAHAALAALDDGERAIVTSAGWALAELRLRHVGLPVPEVLVAAEDIPTGKPAPDGYREAARRLGVAPSACVVVEDTPPGILAGNAAGATVVAVTTTFAPDRLGEAHLVVPSLAALKITREEGWIVCQPVPSRDQD